MPFTKKISFRNVKQPVENIPRHFIIATFLQACGDEQFQNRWMTAETWVKLIQMYYKGNAQFNYKQLNRAIANTKSLS